MENQKRVIHTVSILTIFMIGMFFSASIVMAFSIFGDTLTREDKQGGVDISVTYLPSKDDSNREVSFQLILNTHWVALSRFDLEKISFIQFDDLAAINGGIWGFSGSSHNFKGIITFKEPIPEGTKKLRLLIRDVDGVAERTFEWELPLDKKT